MDDLALLTEMADRTPLPSTTDLAPARTRLMSAIDGEPDKRIRTRRRRFLFSGSAVVGLAAAIIAVIALGGLEQVGVAPPEARAAEVLREAAAAARAQPFVAPRPDQFQYLKSQDVHGSVLESWRSIDGTKQGLLEHSGIREVLGACQVGDTYCDPAYLPDLPTDREGMAEYLRIGMSGVPSDTNLVGKTVMDLFGKILKPDARAALFEALTDFEGLSVDEHAVDSSGRPGIGISWSDNGWAGTFVLDPTTYEYLGVPNDSARLAMGVVDAVGQRP